MINETDKSLFCLHCGRKIMLGENYLMLYYSPVDLKRGECSFCSECESTVFNSIFQLVMKDKSDAQT